MARQGWYTTGQPYGIPYRGWTSAHFETLKARIRECFGNTGPSLSYIDFLSRQAAAANRQLSRAPAPIRSTDPVAQSRQAQFEATRGRAQQRYQDWMDRNRQEAQAQQATSERERSLRSQLASISDEISSLDQLRRFCESLRSLELSQAGRIELSANCRDKIAAVERGQQAQQKAERSHALLSELLEKLKAMPPNNETARTLRHLQATNGYRHPDLSFEDGNVYFREIGAKLTKIQEAAVDLACDEITSKIPIPENVKQAVILDGVGNQPVTRFLCGAKLWAEKLIISSNANHTIFEINNYALDFANVLYLPGDKIEVSPTSPIAGGIPALSLREVSQNGTRINIGNPYFFTINFYSQWTPQLSAYLRQRLP